DSYYGGKQLVISDSIPNLHDQGDGDQISSVCVPDGTILTLFEHDNFKGQQLQVTGPREIFVLEDEPRSGGNWNDEASSIRLGP
ncbi:MAG TPA: beta/gamma crystallin-related protein, partial [Caldilineaceae bacterium]|nr:beta/gamma crystallin-related protein [Caldilineaceae bacterium]